MKAVAAILLSLLVHGLLAVGVAAYVEYGSSAETVAMLDLSSVELSFAEKDDEVETVMTMPAMEKSVSPKKPKEEVAPETQEKLVLPPDPEAPRFREPKETKPKMEEIPEAERHEEPVESAASQPAMPAPRQARVDAPPRPRRNIRPDYPSGARQRGEQGDVVMEILVAADGTVSEVKVVTSSGFGELDDAAVKAAKRARFTPAKAGGESVASSARLKLSFKLK